MEAYSYNTVTTFTDEGVYYFSDMEGKYHASVKPQRRSKNSLSRSWD